MLKLIDDKFEQTTLVEGALAINQAIRTDINSKWVMLELHRLLQEAELALVSETNEKLRLESFVRLFFHEWGFQGNADNYFSSDNAFIDKVLESRKGIPVSLGAIFLYFANKLGFPVSGVTFPTQFILRVDWHGELPLFIDPQNGEYVSQSILKAWLVGIDGPLAKLQPDDTEPTDNFTVIERWLAVLKSTLLREKEFTLALCCSDIALALLPDDPYEIRDRGYIYHQLECPQVAANDYQYFIEQCPDDPITEILKLQVQAFNEVSMVLH